MSTALDPQGKFFLAGTVGRLGMTWRIPEPVTGSLEHVRVWVEALTGMEMKEHDSIVPLDADQVAVRRRQLAEMGGEPLPPP
jgi:hypothetical protein